MGNFFSRSDPQQAVPQDLAGLRALLLQSLTGNAGAGDPHGEERTRLTAELQRLQSGGAAPGASRADVARRIADVQERLRDIGDAPPSLGGQGGQVGGVLGQLLGMTQPGGGEGVLKPLRASADTRLNDQITQLNASSPGRFSSANLFAQGQLRERSQEDFNLLSAQVLERGEDRRLQSILSLLGPALGPAFGGPFTQNPSGWENLLGGVNAAGSLIPGGGGK